MTLCLIFDIGFGFGFGFEFEFEFEFGVGGGIGSENILKGHFADKDIFLVAGTALELSNIESFRFVPLEVDFGDLAVRVVGIG